MTFSEAAFRQALEQPRFSRPAPEFLESNRGVKIRALSEPELQKTTREWFVMWERKLEHLSKLGTDLSWLMEWAQKYWWSWLTRDMSYNHELYTSDLIYSDVTAFGRPIVGIPDFVTYNMAFFDAIPDWRYDPIPDQVYVDVTPEGKVRTVIRYVGSGHWDGPLRLFPYDKSAPAAYGPGTFIQVPAVDRYHFNEDGLMEEGETLYDALDALQRAAILPRDDSFAFKAIFAATKVPGAARRVTSLLNPFS
jgi:hypothetical protein